KSKIRQRAFNIVDVMNDGISRKRNADGMSSHLHGFARWVVERCPRTCERGFKALECLDNFNSGRLVFPRSIAEIDDDVEALTHDVGHLPHRARFLYMKTGYSVAG